MTQEEKTLLSRMNAGEFDGEVGNDFYTNGGSTVWTVIEKGIVTRYKQGPSTRFFNGKENERIPGVLHILKKWETDEEKLEFLQKFGWLMDDPDVNAYSAKFKPNR